MTQLNMRALTASFLVSEANGMYRSRDTVDVIADASIILQPGTVLGRLTAGVSSPVAKPGNTGNATIGSVVPTSDAMIGTYTIRFLTATTFNVIRPNGVLLAPGATGVAYTGEIGFTVTVGATPMIVDDGFNIPTTAAPGDFKRHTLGASDGSQTVAGILLEEVAIGVTTKRTVIVRDCEVVGAHLIHSASATAAQIVTARAALVALGIIVR